jgi:hypothetical protein
MDTPQFTEKEELVRSWTKFAAFLLGFTIFWCVMECAFGLSLGVLNLDLSLIAFGTDSLIEVVSATIVLYHVCRELRGVNDNDPHSSSFFTVTTERKVTLFIGWLLLLFSLFAISGSVFRWIEGQPPASTLYGIIVSSSALTATVWLWYMKTKASVILNSSTLATDARCCMGCMQLSTVLLIGSIIFEFWPQIWWIDSATAIIIAGIIGYEGGLAVQESWDIENFTGESGAGTDSKLAKYFRRTLSAQYGFSFAVEEAKKLKAMATPGGDAIDDLENQKINNYGAINVEA